MKKRKQSSILDIYRKISGNKRPYYTAVLIDLFALLIVFMLSKGLTMMLFNSSGIDPAGFAAQYGRFMILGLFIYYFLVVFIYSFFKYIILFHVQTYFKKQKFSFGRLGKFYVMNILMIVLFLIATIVIVLLLGFLIKKEYLVIFRPVFFVMMFILGYSLLNSIHSYFQQGNDGSDSAKKALKLVFKRPRPLFNPLLWLIGTGIAIWIIQIMLDFLINYLFLNIFGWPYYFYYWTIAVVIVALSFLVLAFFRIFMYARVKEAN